MDVLNVDGRSYVKSSVIARELGYTMDYVGQLCRSKKVKAKLFGRTWYVERDSIESHKVSRYRSTNVVTKRALLGSHRETESELTNKDSKTTSRTLFFYNHSPKIIRRIAFTEDTSDLIPTITKPKAKIDTDISKATKVTVAVEGKQYTLKAPHLPEIKFSGILPISEYEEIKDVSGDTEGISDDTSSATHIHPKNVNKKNSYYVPINKASSDESQLKNSLTIQKPTATNGLKTHDFEGNDLKSMSLTPGKGSSLFSKNESFEAEENIIHIHPNALTYSVAFFLSLTAILILFLVDAKIEATNAGQDITYGFRNLF
jgi:hypothetical protein